MSLDLGELSLTISADASPLERAFSDTQGLLGKVEAAIAAYETDFASGAGKVGADARALYDDVMAEFDRLVPGSRQAAADLVREMSEGLADLSAVAGYEARKTANAVDRELEQIPEGAGDAGEQAGIDLGGKLKAAGVTAATAAAAAIGAAFLIGLDDAMEREVEVDRMTAALGLNPAQAEAYGRVTGRIYADAYGESAADAAQAVEAVASSLEGLRRGAELEKNLEAMTARAMDFATIFGVDVPRAAQLAQQAVNVGLAGDATQAFDLMTASLQQVDVALREDVLDAVGEYGKDFAALGLTGEQAFSALVAASGGGMIGIDKTGDAMKEFLILATDMSESTVGAYESIGLNADKMAADMLAGGDRAQEATQRIAEGLLAITDPVERSNTSIAFFGTMLEDLGVNNAPKFLRSLADAKGGLGDFEVESPMMV